MEAVARRFVMGEASIPRGLFQVVTVEDTATFSADMEAAECIDEVVEAMLALCRTHDPYAPSELLFPVPIMHHTMAGVLTSDPLSFIYPIAAMFLILGDVPPEKEDESPESKQFFARPLRLVYILPSSRTKLCYAVRAVPVGLLLRARGGLAEPDNTSILVLKHHVTTWSLDVDVNAWPYEDDDILLSKTSGSTFIRYMVRHQRPKERLWSRFDPLPDRPLFMRKQDPALELAKRQGMSVFSWDLTKEATVKAYLVAAYSDVFRLRYNLVNVARHPEYMKDPRSDQLKAWNGVPGRVPGRLCLNEVLIPGRETKPFVDLEYEYPKLNEALFTPEAVDKVTEAVIDLMTRVMTLCSGGEVDRTEFVVLDATRPEKVSRHIIYDGGLFLRTPDDVRSFAKLMQYVNTMDIIEGLDAGMYTMARFEPSKQELKYLRKMATMDVDKGCQLNGKKGGYSRSVIDWSMYSQRNKSLRIYDCIKASKPGFRMQLVGDMSKPLERMLGQHKDMLLDETPDTNTHQAVLYSTLLQYVPKPVAKTAHFCIRIAEKHDLETLMARVVKERRIAHKDDAERLDQLTRHGKDLADMLVRGRRKRKRVATMVDMSTRKKQNVTEYGQYTDDPVTDPKVHQRVVEFAMRVVPEWAEQFGDDDHARVKLTVRTFRRASDKRTFFDSFGIYPPVSYCPIKCRDHCHPGKTWMTLLLDGSHLFRCLSSRCRSIMSIFDMDPHPHPQQHKLSDCREVVRFIESKCS
jgi:hypothetical protein